MMKPLHYTTGCDSQHMDRPSLSDVEFPLPPERLYHAAPLAEHDSILAHGLDPRRFPRQRWNENDLGVWCFDTLAQGVDYAERRGQGVVPEPYEVWEIDATGLAPTRPWYDEDLNSGLDIWYLEGAVPLERVRLASSVERERQLEH